MRILEAFGIFFARVTYISIFCVSILLAEGYGWIIFAITGVGWFIFQMRYFEKAGELHQARAETENVRMELELKLEDLTEDYENLQNRYDILTGKKPHQPLERIDWRS